ncbi:hypothetical protein [Sandarakinorhabdus limnophila]|uniref:hypothetical protein n=1 Tax=Sandarakinorhabdus limnophila TaxID=210512 RepID=UPI0026EAF753|nr:hypothetical protein [Sandarakinorhabdus limnophila]
MATTAGQFWDKHVRYLNDRVNWWSSDACTAAYNEQVCGQAVPGNSRGCRIALTAAAGRPLGRGVSVGAGAGDKERALLLDGIVGEMRLWELSEARAAEASRRAAADSVGDRLEARIGSLCGGNRQLRSGHLGSQPAPHARYRSGAGVERRTPQPGRLADDQ